MPWSQLGVDQVKSAYDGINALEIAKDFKPDILLTDVRMPRMDGIELSFSLRKILPSCEIIFMSGYSDKEYLKSAIKLKAVSYVEKPIDLDELEAAIKNAVISNLETTKADDNAKKSIALSLISENVNMEELKQLIGTQHFDSLKDVSFLTFLIALTDSNTNVKDKILSEVDDIISKSEFRSLSCFKNEKLMLIHLFWNKNNKAALKQENLENLFIAISEQLKKYGNFFVSVGNQAESPDKIYESYNAALKALNKSFYYDYSSILYCCHTKSDIYKGDKKIFETFYKHLCHEEKMESILLIKRFAGDIRLYPDTPANHVKDIFYRFFLELIRFCTERKIQINDADLNSQIPFDKFIQFNTIAETETFIIEKIEAVFSAISEENVDKNSIAQITRYIRDNFNDADLSLNTISEHTYLTTAYMCKIFKDNTGTTINKYILEYRINKAKELLKTRGMKISDVAGKVGYTDGNYFTKIFRKETGLTPSEFRQKYLS